jgi:hypothetical protein
MFGAAVTLLSVPVAQAQLPDASDRAKNDVHVIPYLSQGNLVVGPGLAHDMDESVICDASGCLSRTVVLPAEDLRAIEASNGSVYFRADDFAPPRNVEVSAVSASGVDWSETAIWLAVGLAGALGLLGVALVANRSRVRMAHS